MNQQCGASGAVYPLEDRKSLPRSATVRCPKCGREVKLFDVAVYRRWNIIPVHEVPRQR